MAGALLTLAPSIAAEDGPQKRVLALYATTPGAPGAAAFEATYQKYFGDALGTRLDFHSEFVDLARFSEPEYAGALAEFLRYKYQRLPPDVVLATTEPSRRFAEQFRPQMFPGAPVVFIDRVATSQREPHTTGVSAALDLTGSLDLAVTLQPEIERVFVIGGVSAFDRFYVDLAREQFKRIAGRLSFTYLTDQSFAQLQQTVAQLPPRSVIYFLTLGEDGAGGKFLSTVAGDQLARTANAPTYAWNAVGLGGGRLGGRVFSNAVVAERSAAVAMRILRGEKADDIPITPVDASVIQLDWRALRRWNISEARVPAGATILFRELSLWDQYRGYIAGAVALMLLQTALIAGLMVQGARRRRAEREMREHQDLLETSNRHISELFGRLITAQETERSRIARDLHDDVSQRIAALSIAMSGLKRKLLGGTDDERLVASLAAIQRDTAILADEVRSVSHELHPSLLQHTGLVPAMDALCAQFGKLHGITVTCHAIARITSIESDIALCLYRVTQEGLHNIGKHAQARTVAVQLTRTEEGIQLSIADDGKGFDLASIRSRAAGLGLVSMDERVRLLRGTVDIETQPGAGTIVMVRIPTSAATPPAGSHELAV